MYVLPLWSEFLVSFNVIYYNYNCVFLRNISNMNRQQKLNGTSK